MAVNVPFVMIFGRTDLRISLSRAKFDDDEDFEVQKFVDPPKHQISEKQMMFDPKCSPKKNVWRQKMKRWESSETRFCKVWRPCELRSRRKRPFEVSVVGGVLSWAYSLQGASSYHFRPAVI